MALESPGQNIEYILFVLCGRRDVGANPDKARGSPHRPEAPRDLLLELDHTNHPFRRIIGKGHGKIIHEGQNAHLMEFETGEKVLGLRLFGTTPFFRGVRRGARKGIGLVPLFDQLLVSPGEGRLLLGGEGGASLSMDLGTSVDLEEKLPEGGGPGLLQDLLHVDELAENVGVAEGVEEGEDEVGPPAVVNETTRKPGKQIEVLQGLDPPLFMDAVPGEEVGAERVHPDQGGVDPHAGLVGMNDGRGKNLFGDGLEKRIEVGIDLLDGAFDGGRAHVSVKEILAHLRDPIERDELDGLGVGDKSLESGAVLDGDCDPDRKRSLDLLPALGTASDKTAVFGCDQLLGRKVQNLSRIDRQVLLRLKRSKMPAGTFLGLVDHDMIGSLDGRERMAGMALLSSRLLP